MFDNTNPYTLRTEIVEGITNYYISFMDGQALYRETEVSHPVYLEFQQFKKDERNLRRWDERHTEQSELTDESINDRAFHQPKSVEDTVFDIQCNEQLQQAIQSLPEPQRRRFVLYYELGFTYEQIANMEGCTKVSVHIGVNRAKEKIKEKIKFYKNQV